MGFAFTTSEIVADIADQLLLVLRAPASYGIAFDVLVQQLVGIQLCAVTWKKEKTNMVYVFFHPRFDLNRAMDRVAVDNEKHFALYLTHQTPEELQKHLRTKPPLEYHEIETSSIGDGRNHVATKSLSSPWNHWRLTTTP